MYIVFLYCLSTWVVIATITTNNTDVPWSCSGVKTGHTLNDDKAQETGFETYVALSYLFIHENSYSLYLMYTVHKDLIWGTSPYKSYDLLICYELKV